MSQENKNTYGWMGLLFLSAFFFWLIYSTSSIGKEARAIHLYNPHEGIMLVEIDEEQYTLNASEKKPIKISAGQHKVKSMLDQTILVDTTIQIAFELKKNGGLINLSGESLYLWKERYGGSSLVEEQISRNVQILQIDSTIILGNVKEYTPNELVLVKEWALYFDEDFKEEIIASDNQLGSLVGETVAKLFDKKGMLVYWEENYGDLMEGEE